MNKKGFTLIELLAVIVILAIIALIVMPIVVNIVEKAQEGADKRSIEQYAKIIKADYLERKLSDFTLTLDNYLINYASDVNYDGDRVVCRTYREAKNEIELYNCKVNGRGYYNYVNGKVTKTTADKDNQEDIYQDDFDGDINNGPEVEVNAFSMDSWSTIISNVKNGNISDYKVGDTKKVELKGFGTYIVRIANTSTPSECNQEGFSQTACGFVIEFVDIISEYNMNETDKIKGGWKDSAMRMYVNNTIYNSLPEEIKTNIIDTTVVSSYGRGDDANFITTDKLYLLSVSEVWEDEYDTAVEATRQLDYYKNKRVTAYNYGEAIKKYNDRNCEWWLRSAYSSNSYYFYSVAVNGYALYLYNNASRVYGVAPAFRIG